MRRVKTILNLIGDLYIMGHPHFFYQQVIYFPDTSKGNKLNAQIALADIFIDQIDRKLIEEEQEKMLTATTACFFFKS